MKQRNNQAQNDMNEWNNILSIILVLLFIVETSCKKVVEVDPPVTNPISATVYENNTTAAAVLTGIYERMMDGGNLSSGVNSISVITGLSSDELINYSVDATLTQYYKNKVLNSSELYWTELYKYIYTTNAAIEGLSTSNKIAEANKKQLLGEAKFLRAFFYFYLINLFGDVPLNTSTDYKINALKTRNTKAQVYQQIIADLKEAQILLSEDYVNSTNNLATERIRPNRGAATALLARTYLYIGDYINAEAQATIVINNVAFYSLSDNLDDVFLKTSKEAIWQLQPVRPQYNTFDAELFILNSAPNYTHPVTLSASLKLNFENNDARFSNWVGNLTTAGTIYYFPFKYKIGIGSNNVSEYLMTLRLAEQYLIRSESRAQQNNISASQNDVNAIRKRAGLPNTIANDKSSLLMVIEHEWQVEFFTEWGHRWLNLKRVGRIDEVMTLTASSKGSTWNTNWQLYPIPTTEIQNNPNIRQNSGY